MRTRARKRRAVEQYEEIVELAMEEPTVPSTTGRYALSEAEPLNGKGTRALRQAEAHHLTAEMAATRPSS